MTVDEFAKRRRSRDHFLTTVLSEPKLFAIGSENDLEADLRQVIAGLNPGEPLIITENGEPRWNVRRLERWNARTLKTLGVLESLFVAEGGDGVDAEGAPGG